MVLMMMQNSEMLTIKEAAEYLTISVAQVYRLIAQEENPLPVFYLSPKSPRFKKVDLDKWIEVQKKSIDKILEKGDPSIYTGTTKKEEQK